MNATTVSSLPVILASTPPFQSQCKTHLIFSPHRPRLALNSSTSEFKRLSFEFKTHAAADDFGARDPFPAEIESNFADKVLGNVNTEHKILIPNISVLSLAKQQCFPVSPTQVPMSMEDVKMLLRKVLGWRLLDEQGVLKLQCLWKVRDLECGKELINRIEKVTESEEYRPSLQLENSDNQVRAVLWTDSIGGLTMNDFIVAAKIDEIKTIDLAPRKRAWA